MVPFRGDPRPRPFSTLPKVVPRVHEIIHLLFPVSTHPAHTSLVVHVFHEISLMETGQEWISVRITIYSGTVSRLMDEYRLVRFRLELFLLSFSFFLDCI